MYLIIMENGACWTQESVSDEEKGWCDSGVLDIFDITTPELVKRYTEFGWEKVNHGGVA